MKFAFALTILFLSWLPIFFSAALTEAYIPLWNWLFAAFGFLTSVSVMERKINEETKTQIKELFATEKFTKAELGNMFGLAWHTIDRIITGKPTPKVNNKKYYKREKTP
jgi:hypothetical protein